MIARTPFASPLKIGPESNGMLMTPEEFDAIEEYDRAYRYELIHGVLVVNSVPLSDHVSPADFLGYLLTAYQLHHPQGHSLDATLPERYVYLPDGRRIADRVIWAGLGRQPDDEKDPATIAIEIVSESKRDRVRDFEEKLVDYPLAGVKEYWIIDRFQRQMFSYRFFGRRRSPIITEETGNYSTPLLPGFVLSLAPVLQRADNWKKTKRRKP
jgi:Uma2 family endonuclease